MQTQLNHPTGILASVVLAAVLSVDSGLGHARSAEEPGAAAQERKAQSQTAVDRLIGPMINVSAGSFAMGESGTSHIVNVNAFRLMKHEVTFDQYDAFARATGRELPSDGGWGRGNRPVINVSWHDAVDFAQWVSTQTGGMVRLPSEAEWEYAARAGTTTEYWWGDEFEDGVFDDVDAHCKNCDEEWGGQTAPVGSFPANPWGLHDTERNVWEWVQDCEDSSCTSRVLRGGYWSYGATDMRSAGRFSYTPDFRNGVVGFRLAQDL